MQLETITRKPASDPRPTPLLFVHGILHGAWCWDEYFLPYFAEQGYYACALSLRGHAGSPNNKALRLTRIADYVADVKQTADQIENETGARPVIIGHSMGGLITQKYLEKHAAPAGVLLASTPPHGAILATLRVARAVPLTFLKINLQLRLAPLVETIKGAQWSFFSAGMPPEEVAKHQARFGDESYLAFLDMLVLNLPRPGRVSVPVMVLGAQHDTLFSVAEVQRTARAYHTQAEIVPDMAHDVMLEKGWQGVADRIIRWLGEHNL